MTRLSWAQILIQNLEGRIAPASRAHLTKEEAAKHLREATGRDFGDDVRAWKNYLREHGKEHGLRWP